MVKISSYTTPTIIDWQETNNFKNKTIATCTYLKKNIKEKIKEEGWWDKENQAYNEPIREIIKKEILAQIKKNHNNTIEVSIQHDYINDEEIFKQTFEFSQRLAHHSPTTLIILESDLTPISENIYYFKGGFCNIFKFKKQISLFKIYKARNKINKK